MDTTELDLDTSTTTVLDLTDAVRDFCAGRGDGLLNVFVPHATAGVAVIECGAGSEEDLDALLRDLIPRSEGRYRHRHGSPGHGADHLLPALVGPSLVLPVRDGTPTLGTWQHVVLVDLNEDNPRRRVRLSFLSA